MHIHVLGDVVKDFFVGCSSSDDDQHLLFVTREYVHLTRSAPFAILDMHEDGPIVSRIHIAHPQIA